MADARTWAVHGHGLIGQELERQIGQLEVAERLNLEPLPSYFTRTSGVYHKSEYRDGPDIRIASDYREMPDVDITFLALPSSGDGEHAKSIIERSIESGGVAVTAEKAAAANHFDELREISDDFSSLGIRATVGGGTRLIPVLKEFCRDPSNVSELHVSLNGTKTAIMSSVGPAVGARNAMSLGQAVEQAVELGYAEPGSTSPYDVIRSEAEGDIPRKTAILLNALGLLGKEKGAVPWQAFQFELSHDDIRSALSEAKVRRFVVSMFNEQYKYAPESDRIGGFSTSLHGWTIVGGFQHIERNPLLAPLGELSGPGNGFVINLGPNGKDGKYMLDGPGAGPSPTVNTMLDDLTYLEPRRK